MSHTVNERSTAYLDVEFTDRDGQLAAPQAVTYRIDDVITGDEVRGNTDIDEPAAQITITLSASETRIISGRSEERRRVTVRAVYGEDDELHGEFVIYVRNLDKAPLPEDE